MIANHNMMPALPSSPAVVNHDLRDCTSAKELSHLLGSQQYPGRSLCTTQSGDVIQLDPAIKPGWDWIMSHYRDIGLPVTGHVVWDSSFETSRDLLLQRPDDIFSVFFFGDEALSAIPNADDTHRQWRDWVALLNQKNFTIQLAQKLGADVPNTRCYMSKWLVRDLSQVAYPCYLKISESVTGLGIERCEGEGALANVLELLDMQTEFQIQDALPEGTIFLNLQYIVRNGKPVRFAVTEQILDGNTHNGNVYPSRYCPWSLVDPLAEFVVDRGMQGVFAFDVAVVFEEDTVRFYVIECNPRFNGATYPSILASRLGISNWSHENFTSKLSLDAVDLGGLSYRPGRQSGVIVVNWGPIAAGSGKVGIMLVGDESRRNRLRDSLRSVLS